MGKRKKSKKTFFLIVIVIILVALFFGGKGLLGKYLAKGTSDSKKGEDKKNTEIEIVIKEDKYYINDKEIQMDSVIKEAKKASKISVKEDSAIKETLEKLVEELKKNNIKYNLILKVN